MNYVRSLAIGVDLGATKVNVALVDDQGQIHRRIQFATRVEGGPEVVLADVAQAIRDLKADVDSPLLGVGVGLAGQIDAKQGLVFFAPNLGWRDVPFQTDLSRDVGLSVVVTNDVRVATWGEWVHGAGKGCDDLVCVFVGTGIGGGMVCGGKVLSGCSNTAAEIGHMTIDLNGPPCTCGHRGCLEALAGGWAIARRARQALSTNPSSAANLLRLAGGDPQAITAKTVAEATRTGDPLAKEIFDEVTRALIAGAVSLVNALNPCRLILGGGVIEGFPELVERIAQGVRVHALPAAVKPLMVLPAKLRSDAGAIGAATLAMHAFKGDFQHGGFR